MSDFSAVRVRQNQSLVFFVLKLFSQFVFLSIFLLLSGCGVDEPEVDVNRQIESGRSYFLQGQYRAALIGAETALQAEEANEAATVLLAQVYLAMGRPRASIARLESINGTSKEYFETLAESYINRRKYGSALHLLRQNAKLFDESSVKYHLQNAAAYFGIDERDKAREYYAKAAEIEPKNVAAQLGMVKLEAVRGDLEKARLTADDLLSKNPENLDILLVLSDIYIRQGDLENAETSLTEAIGALPVVDLFTKQRAQIMSALVALLARQGRSGEALVYQRSLAEAFPMSAENNGKFQDAIASLKDGQIRGAARLLEEIMQTAPGDEASGSLLGILRYFDGDFESANNYFENSVDAEIAPPYVLRYMATNMYQLGQLGRIVRSLEGRIENSEDANLLAIYGVAALNASKEAEGIKALQRAIVLQPSNVRLTMILAQYYNKTDPPEEKLALGQIQSALLNNPDNYEIQSVYLNQLLTMSEIEVAKDFVDTKLTKYHGQIYPLIYAGVLQTHLENFSLAAEKFSQAIDLDPKEKNARYGLANAYMQTGQWELARKTYQVIVALDATDIRAYRGILASYDNSDKAEVGVENFQKLMADRDEVATAVVAEYFAGQDRLGEAEALVDQMERFQPDSPRTRRLIAQVNYQRALGEFQKDNYEDARSAIFKALGVYPRNSKLLTLLVQIEIKTQQFVEAEKVISEFGQYYPDSHETKELLGDLETVRGDFGKAIGAYRLAWEKTQDDLLAQKLFQAYQGDGRTSDAEAFTYEWETRMPESSLAIVNRVEFLDDPLDAIRSYENWLSDRDPSYVVLNNLALLYLENTSSQKASEAARQAYEISPNNASVVDTLGWVLVKSGKYEEGLRYLRKSLKLLPDSELVAEHINAAESLIGN
jgi:cellulose synthase operon protein C